MKMQLIENPRNGEANQIAYITAPTLNELEEKVNGEIAEFQSYATETLRCNVDTCRDVKFINGEYVQQLEFSTWKMRTRPRRPIKLKKKPVKKTAAKDETATPTV